jgi:putative GTP pyrophosphokinase
VGQGHTIARAEGGSRECEARSDPVIILHPHHVIFILQKENKPEKGIYDMETTQILEKTKTGPGTGESVEKEAGWNPGNREGSTEPNDGDGKEGSTESIYGDKKEDLLAVRDKLMNAIQKLREQITEQTGSDPVEHCLARIKSEESMREKCRRRNLPETTESALTEIFDAVGIRVVCAFVNDVYLVRDYLENLPDCEIVQEKDYIRHAKPNGYRSLHLILKVRLSEDRSYYAEIQIRTISMDTWAALEHNIRYKHEIKGNLNLIESELKRCADELASTDMSMQTIRDMIREEGEK